MRRSSRLSPASAAAADPSYAKWSLTRPGTAAGIMVVAAGAAILQREPLAAASLSGVVVGFGLSGSV